MSEGGEFKPKHLGKRSSEPVKELDLIPWTGGNIHVVLDCTEFTSFCPVTSMPDFAEITVEYSPDKSLIETKSMKLYMMGYRDEKEFNEKLVDRLVEDLFKQVAPRWICVEGKFNVRGGIKVTASAERYKEEE